jgi:hypothetical protein
MTMADAPRPMKTMLDWVERAFPQLWEAQALVWPPTPRWYYWPRRRRVLATVFHVERLRPGDSLCVVATGPALVGLVEILWVKPWEMPNVSSVGLLVRRPAWGIAPGELVLSIPSSRDRLQRVLIKDGRKPLPLIP